MSFGEHLEELRLRLIWAVAGIAPIFLASIYFGDYLLSFVLQPVRAALHNAKLPVELIATGPLETLGAWLKVGGVVTVALGVPWLIYQLWLFIAPGLYENEKRFARFLIPFSVVLSILGLAFLYYIMLPAMLAFLIRFGSTLWEPAPATVPLPQGTTLSLKIPLLEEDPQSSEPGAVWINRSLGQLRVNTSPADALPTAKPEIRGIPLVLSSGIAQQYRISEYISLVFTMSIAFIAGFQTPIVVLLLGWVGIFDLKTMQRSRKYALFVAFVVGAILTPSPDPFSMTVLAIPLYILYELGLFILKYLPPERVARGIRPTDLITAPDRREPPDAGDE